MPQHDGTTTGPEAPVPNAAVGSTDAAASAVDAAGAGSTATRVRIGAKALIVRDDCLLVTVNTDRTGEFYLLPGGGIEPGESTLDALRRECLEEVSLEVRPGELACVRDYIGANHEFAEWDAGFHQIDLMFWATPVDPMAEPAVGTVGDTFQVGARWLPLAELDEAPFWPQALKEWLRLPASERPTYLGAVN